MGGEDVTKDISIWMQVDIKEAEEIKRTHGMVVLSWMIQPDSQLDLVFLSEIINKDMKRFSLKLISI